MEEEEVVRGFLILFLCGRRRLMTEKDGDWWLAMEGERC